MPLENLFADAHGKPRTLTVTTRVPHSANAVFVVAGCDQCLVVTEDTKESSWAYSIQRRTGEGATDDRGSYPYRLFFDHGQENCGSGLLRPLECLGRGGACNDDWYVTRDVALVHITEHT